MPTTISLVGAAATLAALQCAPSTLASNASTTCTVTLSKAAAIGTVVSLANSAPSVLTVASSVTIPANANSATFTASTGTILSDQSATITAILNGASISTTLSLVSASPVTISALQCTPSTVASNASTACTLTLSKAAASNTMVTLSSSAPFLLTVPSAAIVAANATSAAFFAAASSLFSDQSATITATLNGSSMPTTLSLVASLTLSDITVSAIAATGATINWNTSKGTDSHVTYGATASYGSVSTSGSDPVTSHTVNLTGLAPSSIYHYKVVSRDALGTVTESGDFTLTTPAGTGSQILLQLHSDATEVSGVTNGSIVTPAIAPSGFAGKVVVSSGGSVNFAPAQAGNGVYFLNCCDDSANAYYKFPGTTVGSVFNVSQGQISFYLKSRQTFAHRLASGTLPQQVLDVRDGSAHLFQFVSAAGSNSLVFGYTVAGATAVYVVPPGTEEALFGEGITLKVAMMWDGSVAKLYLNDNLVQQSSYVTPTPNWDASSNFVLGAYEDLTSGTHYACDDIIDEFTVAGAPPEAQATLPTISPLECTAAGLASNGSTTCAVAPAKGRVGDLQRPGGR